PGESSKEPALKAVLYVRSEAFWTRVGLFTDLGLAESFMMGEIDCDDITSLLKIIILNRKQMGEVQSIAGPIAALCRSLAVYSFAGTMSNSRANISSHYDIGNIMFDAFLSKDMNYSCAIFKDHEEDISNPSRESLEDAQMRKMKAILGKAKIQDGDNILEIGTGWGSLSILAAQTRDCTVTTITLSVDQMMLAVKRIAEAGLTDRISVHLMDFREILMNPEWKGAFNKFISIEMMEHVGKDFMEEYWKVVDYVLKEDSGVGVVQLTTLPESRVRAYDQGIDFIQKWVFFPGAYIPSVTFLFETMKTATEGRLTVDSVANIGPHYARTLREWKQKFLDNWGIIAEALVSKYNLKGEDLNIFRRKWIYYFDYCDAGFATRTLGDHIITFTREGNMEYGCSLSESFA
ncbi:hypothetical protein M422DRAFT_173066, partial [Sphaerobolus stellatus SS14]